MKSCVEFITLVIRAIKSVCVSIKTYYRTDIRDKNNKIMKVIVYVSTFREIDFLIKKTLKII
jgi:RNA-binding protein YlmH